MSIYGPCIAAKLQAPGGERATISYVDDAVRLSNERYIPRKPVITICAEERGGLRVGEYEWSFGNNANHQYTGYPMSASGTILRMALSSVTQKGHATGEVRVNLVLNGVEQRAGVTKHADHRSAFTIFDTTPIRAPAGSVINFVTKTADSSSYASVVALLIELDL